jgi:hypothetical protein
LHSILCLLPGGHKLMQYTCFLFNVVTDLFIYLLSYCLPSICSNYS